MPGEQVHAITGSNLWALLIGIDKYKGVSGLRGCVNDVQAMRLFLMNNYNVPDDHIHVLINEEATRDTIKKAFQEFLIDNQAIQQGDQILFHYSGHGSQMPTRPGEFEPDGLNETIVPYDSRTGDIYDIPDKTLAALLDQLVAAKGDQITVILDSCHSGSATRAFALPFTPKVRSIPPDDRPPPADLDADLWCREKDIRRGIGPSGWASATTPYILLAGCRDREVSNEYRGRVEDAEAWHGALTFFTLQVLQDLPDGATYADLHERVMPLVNAHYPNQTPQCEGERDRAIFGSTQKQHDSFITVQGVSADGKTVTLEAGFVQGLRPGTELSLYPPEVQTLATLPSTPLATVAVQSVKATTSTATAKDTPAQRIPLHAHGVIIRQTYKGLRQNVRLENENNVEHSAATKSLRQAIENAAGDGVPSPYLKIEDDPQCPIDLLVRTEKGQFAIYDANVLLVEPEPIHPQSVVEGDAEPAVKVCHILESIARYRSVLSLRNDDRRSPLVGKVKLRLRRYVDDPEGPHAEDLPVGVTGPGGELNLYFDPDHEEYNRYVVEVINESQLNVYPYILALNADYSIGLFYPPEGLEAAITPNNTYPIGLQEGTDPLKIQLPPGWDASRDYLKAIVTTKPTDLRLLEQPALNVPPQLLPKKALSTRQEPTLQDILETMTFGEGTKRLLCSSGSSTGENWAVTQLAITTVRQYQTTKLLPAQGRVPLSEEVLLVKPAGFTGEARVTTIELATRGEESDPTLKPPPGLARFPELFELVGRSGTRGIGDTGLVIALTVDEPSRQLITPENPLRLEFPTLQDERVAELLPIAFDGEDYLLVGYGTEDKKAVNIISLPELAPLPEGQPARRGIGETIRFFIYKKMGRFIDELGLHCARLKENGEVEYSAVQGDQFQPGQKVAVFVHGFTSDSRWMVKQPAQFLCQQVQPYDHLLTWDYETFGTSIQENGEQFALALKQQCGFGPDDGITVDVYAHSMGTLVTRCMVDLFGGCEFVDHVVLAGPPNRGTTLASTSRGIVFLLTMMLNKASLGLVLGTANWALRQWYEQGIGVADLAVDSPLQKKLNDLEEPSNVPYLVLAGENVLNENEKNMFNRLAHKILDAKWDTFFGEENDTVIGISSMKGLRHGVYPLLTVEMLPCDHSHYFDTPEGQQAIKQCVNRWYSIPIPPTPETPPRAPLPPRAASIVKRWSIFYRRKVFSVLAFLQALLHAVKVLLAGSDQFHRRQ